MSIQQSKYSGVTYRICNKLKLIKLFDNYLILIQFLLRKLIFFFSNNNNLNIFFEYYNHYTHPSIRTRYYGKNAPISWVTLKSSRVAHIIHFDPQVLNKKIIFEPNDCCQKVGSFLNIHQPYEFVNRCKEISDYICNSTISRVLIGNNDVINHAKYYFSEQAIKKFFIYPEMSCTPVVTKNFLEIKHNQLLSNRKIKFLSVASDFRKKAVELLLEAFMESQVTAELTLVCHNVTDNFKRKILTSKNIFLIDDLSLSNNKRDRLYKNSDVYINTTYIDGGAVAVTALEYGLPIITHTYHRGKSYIENNNGVLLTEPMKYYDPEGYGIRWNSIDGYLEQIDLLKKKGGYIHVQKQLIDAIKYYEQHPAYLFIQSLKSLELAEKNSLVKSNQILMDLYKKVASE